MVVVAIRHMREQRAPTFPRFTQLVLVMVLIAGGVCTADEKRNPLGELFRGIDRGIRKTGKELEWAKTGRDQLDVRPIQRTEDMRRLAQAEEMMQKSRWHDAIEILQYLLDQPTDAFTFNTEQSLRSLQGEIDQQLNSLPEEARRNYLNTFSVTADQRLRKALEEQDELGLQNLARQYFHTPAGQTATETLAQLLQERGEFAQAASLWKRLAATATGEPNARYQQALARALASSGQLSAAKLVADGLGDAKLKTTLELLSPDPVMTSSAIGPYQTFNGAMREKDIPAPNLTAIWHAPLIERYSVRTQLRELQGELSEQGRTLIPTIQPLTIGDKLAVRTLRSLQVRDLSTGRLIWEQRTPESPEQLAAKQEEKDDLQAEESLYYQEALFENHQLASLVFRDEVYGGLSSDGMRLFAVESSGEAAMNSPVQMWNHSDEGTATDTPWATNELTAYDLENGRLIWRIGGAQIEDPFSLPLAGTYFFGPPTPSGHELYVTGERDEAVSLFCLNARTGELLWSQPIAASARPIGIDTVRRHWLCRPVIAEGVIICPTTCGWAAGVDQATHRLLWGARFSARNTQTRHMRGGVSVQTMQELNRRWQCSVPFASQGRVVLTPPDMPDEIESSQPAIVCLDLHTGQTLWSHLKSASPTGDNPSGENLYLAGIWNDHAVVVGNTHVTTRRVSGHGEILWHAALPDRPSGRGIIVNGKLLVPVRSGALVRIDLKSGKIDLKSLLFEERPHQEKVALGNLTISGDQLVSATYSDLNVYPAFPQTSAPSIDTLLVARQTMTQARQQLIGGRWQDALAALAATEKFHNLPPNVQAELSTLEFDCLTAKLRVDPTSHQATLEKLQQLATALNKSSQYQRVLADHFFDQGEWEQSLRVLLTLLEESPVNDIVTEGSRQVRIDGWTGGRLQSLFASLTEDTPQARFVELVQEAVRRVPDHSVQADRWARALSFHPLGMQLELKLAKADFAAGRSGAGLIRVQRVIGGSDQALQLDARRMQADQLTALKWNGDALRAWQQLLSSQSKTFSNGEAVEPVAKAGIAKVTEQSQSTSLENRWKGDWRVERMGMTGDEAGFSTVDLSGPGFQSLRTLRILQADDRQRFRVEDASTGQFYGSFPALSLPALGYQSTSAARLQGSSAFIVHQGVLHALDWTKKDVVWTWSPEARGAILSHLEAVQRRQHSLLLPASQFLTTRQLRSQREQTGFLVGSTDRELMLLCRDLIALDPISGQELWREQTVPERGVVEPLGSQQFLVASRNHTQLRRTIDGHILKDGKLDSATSRNFAIVDGDPIILKRKGVQASGDLAMDLQRLDWNGNVRWTLELPANPVMTVADENFLIWMSQEHELFLVDLVLGQQKSLIKLSENRNDAQHPVRILSDSERFYVIVDDGKAPASHVNLSGFPVSGSIIAFNRSGQHLWTYVTPFQAAGSSGKASPHRWPLKFMTLEFLENPMILLVSDSPESTDDHYFHRLKVIGLDKSTGKVLVDWNQPSESGGFSYLHVDAEQHAIELRTYNEQLRLSPVKQTTASPAAPQ